MHWNSRPRRSTTLRGLSALAVIALVATACGGGDGGGSTDNGGTDTVQLGVLPIVEVAPIYLGMKKGFYADEKIKVQPHFAQGGAAIVPAVVSGQYEFGFSNVVSLMLARTKGLKLTMIASSSETTGQVGKDLSAVVVNGDSPIKTAKDLEGKTVSVNTLQNIGDVTVKAAMEVHGADGSKVKFVEMALPDMQAALEQGRIDAAWLVEPFLSAAMGDGAKPVLWNYAEADPKLIIAGYFTSDKLRKQNPDLVKRFLSATQKSMVYAQSHPNEVRQILTTYTKMTPDQTKAVVLPRYSPTMDQAVLGHIASLVKKYGLTKQTPDVSALIGQ